MSHPYTDRFGYPLTAAQAAARMNAPKRRGYYNAQGQWVRLPTTAKRAPAKPEAKPKD
jgi:hypothetical protein